MRTKVKELEADETGEAGRGAARACWVPKGRQGGGRERLRTRSSLPSTIFSNRRASFGSSKGSVPVSRQWRVMPAPQTSMALGSA